ncbi:MAG: S-methyl-5-thioribose-1-phosphate isomerase [Anaerolineae bacterium]|nr:S-methyl-5-thioribose-1-phosphate isomerase [Anaerolineae bacterium]
MIPVKTIEWVGDADGACRIIDQTLLPTELRYLDLTDSDAMWEAIRSLRVRGAPAIGIAAAFGVYLGVRAIGPEDDSVSFVAELERVTAHLATSRPTAVNLFWALERVNRIGMEVVASGGPAAARRALLAEAVGLIDEDNAACRALGAHGAALVADGDTILTHCNAGSLATAQWGTALAVVYMAAELGKRLSVYADETRPLLQGARLTAWELQQAGVPVTVITDSMAATVMAQGRVNAVIVGTDRVAANGDFANKIGTLGVAILAREFGIPLYVAAPLSSVDLNLASGAEIPIEERKPEEVSLGFGRRTAPEGVAIYNPAFDVTPARYVTAFITERGVVRAPFAEGLARVGNSPSSRARLVIPRESAGPIPRQGATDA